MRRVLVSALMAACSAAFSAQVESRVPPGRRDSRHEGIWQGHLSLLDKDPKHNTSP